MLEQFFITAIPANAEVGSYNYGLVMLSFFVATLASRTALSLFHWLKSTRLPRKEEYRWQLIGSISLGGGIWSMHFIGMLAYEMRMQVSYNVWLTLFSLVIAVTVAYAALSITKRLFKG